MALSDTSVRNAKPAAKPTRLFDSGGLYLEIAPSGGKWWRLLGFKESSQRRLLARWIVGGQAPRQAFSIPASCGVCH